MRFLIALIKEQKTQVRNMVLKLCAIHYLPQIFDKDYGELVKTYDTFCTTNSIDFKCDYDTFCTSVELVCSSVDLFQSVAKSVAEFFQSDSSVNFTQIYKSIKCFQTNYMVDVKNSTVREIIHLFGSCCLTMVFVYDLRCILSSNIIGIKFVYHLVVLTVLCIYYTVWTEMYKITNFVSVVNSLLNVEDEIANITEIGKEIKNYFDTLQRDNSNLETEAIQSDDSNLEVEAIQSQGSWWSNFRTSCSSIGKGLRKVSRTVKNLKRTYNMFKTYSNFFASMRKY
jgi:hypothetical protein